MRKDTPSVLHCPVNPACMREFGNAFSKEIVDWVISQKTLTLRIDCTDNEQLAN